MSDGKIVRKTNIGITRKIFGISVHEKILAQLETVRKYRPDESRPASMFAMAKSVADNTAAIKRNPTILSDLNSETVGLRNE